jgi:hypothetical protein
MKLYLIAIAFTFAATVVIINACVLYASATRAAPVNIYQLK